MLDSDTGTTKRRRFRGTRVLTWSWAAALAYVLSTTTSLCAGANERLSRDEAVEDVRYLVRALEETHPDPYTAFGGKVAFKLRAGSLIAAVPEAGLTPEELYTLAMPFLGALGDGHTSLRPPFQSDGVSVRHLAIEFAVAADATFIAGATAGYERLIGQRLVAVENVPLDELQARAGRLLPAENEFGAARAAARALQSTRYVPQLLGHEADTLRLGLLDAAGTKVESRVPFLPADAPRPARPEKAWAELDVGNDAIWWRYLATHGVGYLRLASIEGREAFEDARGRRDLPKYVGAYYHQYLQSESPADIDSAVAGVPCFTESVAALLDTMRSHGGRYLVVDLRQNGGGWSSLCLPLYLLTYGDDYLDHVFPGSWVDVASPGLLRLNSWSVDDLHAKWGADYEEGDYRRTPAGAPRKGRSDSAYAEDLEDFGCGLAERFRQLDGRASYRPVVIALVDTGTFSAAFQLAYHLSQLGALLVGVPPAQAGNAFTNVVPLELPHSHLRGSVARSAQIYFPDDPERGRVLQPDFPVTWDVYALYGFDSQSELRYTLDLIAAGRVQATAGH